MEQAAETKTFLDAVEQSFLPEDEKAELAESAKAGVTSELWNTFNDRLIAAIVRTQEHQRASGAGLDDEINKFTAEYEKEKSVIDFALRTALAKAKDDAARSLLWEEYGVTIRELQAKLVAEVKSTSTTVLHDVILAVVPEAARRWNAASE
ncbi:MAG: hypothetical protein RL272_145 [Candidatus Parcubacteria bacterium]|jgi:hypothetical protein